MSAALDIYSDGMLDMAIPALPERWMVKATPKVEGGRRYVYIEASHPGTDLQGERVLQEALWASRDYFVRKGNLDLDHISKIGLKMSPPVLDYYNYEIGRPVEVKRQENGNIWVKGVIYQGNEHAENFWRSLSFKPPQIWFASVAGAVLGRTRARGVSTIVCCRWSNLGFSNEAVNHHLKQPITNEPVGPFMKATVLEFAKALSAGYGTDTAQLTGGGALRRESLSGKIVDPYERFRNYASRIILKGGGQINPSRFQTWATECGFGPDEAPKVAKRFMTELLGKRGT